MSDLTYLNLSDTLRAVAASIQRRELTETDILVLIELFKVLEKELMEVTLT